MSIGKAIAAGRIDAGQAVAIDGNGCARPIRPKSAFEQNRMRILRIPLRLLELLITPDFGPDRVALPRITQLPPGATFHGMSEDFCSRSLRIIVAHESYDPVEPGGEIPAVEILDPISIVYDRYYSTLPKESPLAAVRRIWESANESDRTEIAAFIWGAAPIATILNYHPSEKERILSNAVSGVEYEIPRVASSPAVAAYRQQVENSIRAGLGVPRAALGLLLCPDCIGSGKFKGMTIVEECGTCGGTGRKT